MATPSTLKSPDRLYKSSSSDLGPLSLQTQSPAKGVGRWEPSTVKVAKSHLRVMCWNVIDVGGGIGGIWKPLPDMERFDGPNAERYEKWRAHQLSLTSSDRGPLRGGMDGDLEKNWLRWLHLADLARHIVTCDAHVTVLLEILTSNKGGGAFDPTTANNRMALEVLIGIAEGSRFGAVQAKLEDYLVRLDEKIERERHYYLEDFYINEKPCRISEAREMLKDDLASFYKQRLTELRTEGKGLGEKLPPASSTGAVLYDFHAMLFSNDVKDCAAKLMNFMKVMNPDTVTSSNSTVTSPSSVAMVDTDEVEYGLQVLESLNKILAEVYLDPEWKFIAADDAQGETIAVCVRKSWTLHGDIVKHGTGDKYRPMYQFSLTNGTHQAVVHAAHAPAPSHLPSLVAGMRPRASACGPHGRWIRHPCCTSCAATSISTTPSPRHRRFNPLSLPVCSPRLNSIRIC